MSWQSTWFIARRYFWARSQKTIVNRITSFAFIVVAIATAALFVVLSAFSGLKDFGVYFSSAFDPDYRIFPLQGKQILLESHQSRRIETIPGVDFARGTLQEKVFLSYQEKSMVAYMFGVPDDMQQLIPLEDHLFLGDPVRSDTPQGAVVGYGISDRLGLGVFDYSSFLNLSVPKTKGTSVLQQQSFTSLPFLVQGIYQISEDLDQKFVFVPLTTAQQLLSYPSNTYSSIDLKTSALFEAEEALSTLEKILDQPLEIRSKDQMNAALFKMLNTENVALYFIFSLVLVIALFNVVGALLMMILDKRAQVRILLAMGHTFPQLRQLFLVLGLLIVGSGALVGLVLASILLIFQKYTPFIFVPGTTLAYPVAFEFGNLVLVITTVLAFGSLTAYWTSRTLRPTLIER